MIGLSVDDLIFSLIDAGHEFGTKGKQSMKVKNERLSQMSFKIHPEILDEIDKRVDNIRYRSRAHLINVALCDWFENHPVGEKRKIRHKRKDQL